MRYCIRHETRYTYSEPVALDPHVFRLTPRHGDGIQIHRTHLGITPEPQVRFTCEEATGNVVHHACFEGSTRHLGLTNRIELSTHTFNPFGYLIHPAEAARLPIQYPPEFMPLVVPYLRRATDSLAVAAFAAEVARDGDHETVRFCATLASRIRDTVRHTVRQFGPPNPPERTLKAREGACRDLAVLMIDACRVVGLAARFVSGYVLDHDSRHLRELHAWAEVYIPGGGWRGFDPSTGLAVASRHVPLAVGSVPAHAAPVEGTFRGDNAQVELDHEVRIEPVEEYADQGAL